MTDPRHDQFAELFVRNQSRVYAYVTTMLPNRSDAEEVFQQTSLILWKKWDQFDPARDFVRWACGIAHFEVLNFIRRSDHKHQHLSETLLQRLSVERAESESWLEQRKEALAGCLKKLPEKQRDAFDRCYNGQQTIRTIAEESGQTPNALYMLLRRIRRTLFECVNQTLRAEA